MPLAEDDTSVGRADVLRGMARGVEDETRLGGWDLGGDAEEQQQLGAVAPLAALLPAWHGGRQPRGGGPAGFGAANVRAPKLDMPASPTEARQMLAEFRAYAEQCLQQGGIPLSMESVLQVHHKLAAADVRERFRMTAARIWERNAHAAGSIPRVPARPELLQDEHYLLVLQEMASKELVERKRSDLRSVLKQLAAPIRGHGAMSLVADMGYVYAELAKAYPDADFESFQATQQAVIRDELLARAPENVRWILEPYNTGPESAQAPLRHYRKVIDELEGVIDRVTAMPTKLTAFASGDGDAGGGSRRGRGRRDSASPGGGPRSQSGGKPARAFAVQQVPDGDAAEEDEPKEAIHVVTTKGKPRKGGGDNPTKKTGGKPAVAASSTKLEPKHESKSEDRTLTTIRCWNCNEIGHRRAECPKAKTSASAFRVAHDGLENVVVHVTLGGVEHEALADSGCSVDIMLPEAVARKLGSGALEPLTEDEVEKHGLRTAAAVADGADLPMKWHWASVGVPKQQVMERAVASKRRPVAVATVRAANHTPLLLGGGLLREMLQTGYSLDLALDGSLPAIPQNPEAAVWTSTFAHPAAPRGPGMCLARDVPPLDHPPVDKSEDPAESQVKYIYARMDLSPAEKTEFAGLVKEFSDVFTWGLVHGQPHITTTVVTRTELKPGAVPRDLGTRPMSPKQTEEMWAYVQEAVQCNVIREVGAADPKYILPMFAVPKKNGQLRFVADARVVNADSVEAGRVHMDAREYASRLWQIAPRGVEGRLPPFVKADVVAAFNCVELDADTQSLFGFRARNPDTGTTHTFVFQTLVMGATNSPYYLTRVLGEVFAPVPNLVLYMDDILTMGATAFKAMLACCRAHNVRIKPSPDMIGRDVEFCGHRLTEAGITMPTKSVETLVPAGAKTARDVGSIVWFLTWAASYVPRFKEMVAPLEDYLARAAAQVSSTRAARLARVPLTADANPPWTPELAERLEAVVDMFHNRVVLAFPRPGEPIYIFTDASTTAWGGVAVQTCRPGSRDEQTKAKERAKLLKGLVEAGMSQAKIDATLAALPDMGNVAPFAVLSGVWKKAERNYSIVDKELTAAVMVLDALAFYVQASETKLFVDARAVVALLHNPELVWHVMARKSHYGRMNRAIAHLGQLPQFTVQHLPGVANVYPDLLSRPFSVPDAESDRAQAMAVQRKPRAGPSKTNFMLGVGDLPIANIVEVVQEHLPPGPVMAEAAEYGAAPGEHGLLWVGRRVYLPETLRAAVIAMAHMGAGNHRTADECLRQLGDFFWPGMETDVAREVDLCLVCAAAKPGRPVRPLGTVIQEDKPFKELHMDLVEMPKSPLGNQMVVGVDPITGYLQVLVVGSTAQDGAIRFVDGWIATTGQVPVRIHTDNGPSFQSRFRDHVEKLGARHTTSLPGNSQGNGAVERVNRSLVEGLRAGLAEAQKADGEWASLLPSVVAAINTLPSAARGGHAPVTLAFGAEVPTLSRRLLAVMAEESGTPLTQGQLEAIVLETRGRGDAARSEAREARARELARRAKAEERDWRVEPLNVEVGDYVLCARERETKTQTPFSGPYQVTRAGGDLGPLVIEVRRVGSDDVKQVHAREVRHFMGKEYKIEDSPAVQRFADYTAPQRYVIEALVGVRRDGRSNFKFEVAWRGYPGENTWEPAVRVNHDAPGAVQAFLKRTDLPPDQARILPALARMFEL